MKNQMPPLNWQQYCRNAFETHWETLYKDFATGVKKWVRITKSKITGAPDDGAFVQYFGPNDEGPFKSEEELFEFLPHQTFPHECDICGHKMQFVIPVGVKQVACTNCHTIIEVPSTFKDN